MKSISIIIPTYNGQELLDKNLPSVVEACENYGGEWEVVIVDDGSSNSFVSKEGLRGIKCIQKETNEGFSRAMNVGIKEAKGDIIISLNNDVKVEPGFISPLLAQFSDSTMFSVKPKSILPDGQNESLRAIKINKGMIEAVIVGEQAIKDSKFQVSDFRFQELPYSCAGSAAYDKNKLLELGGFDEIYSPFYWEDFDLGYRAVKRGWKNIYESESVVYHEHSATIANSKNLKIANTRDAIFIRNREIFYWKNICDFKSNTIAHLRWPVRFIKAVLFGDKDIVVGLIGFLKVLPLVVKKRRKEKKNTKIKDRVIIDKFKTIKSN